MQPPPSSLSNTECTCRFTGLRGRVVLVGIIVICGIIGSAAYDAWRSYQQTVAQTHRELTNLAKALAEQGARSLQTIDIVLRDTARWYADIGHGLNPDSVEGALANRAAGLPQVYVLTIVDAHGVERYRSRAPTPPLNVADRSYFVSQRTGRANGFFVSEPLTSRADNRSTIVVSRRMTDGNGIFAGVVTAVVDLADLQNFYSVMELGAGSAINVVRDDGTLVVRHPPVDDSVGRKFPELVVPTDTGPSVAVSTVDAQPRYIAVARMRALPLVLTVTRERTVALAPWRTDTISLAVRTAVGVLLTLLTMAILLHQLRRLQAGEKALRESEERYALAMEGASEGHWDWDLASDRIFASPSMKALMGLSADAGVETRAELLASSNVHPDDLPTLHAVVDAHIEGRTPLFELEYRVRHHDGEWHWLLARGRALRDDAGSAIRFVGSAIDVSARRHAQDGKARLEAQLRQSQKMEAMGTLAGGIAHDFNNILGAILGYSELAHKHTASGSVSRRYLDNVMQAAGRAKTLVERILGFSRSGLSERTSVHVQFVVEETLELVAASLTPRVRVEKVLDCGDAAVVGDPTQLQQVAMNLLTNALQAMDGGGVLTVRLDCVDVEERRTLTEGELSAGSYVRLVVGDTGVGIPEAALERIFDPFYTTKSVGEGTGLGLSVVHGIVADLGGAIEVETELGRGTTFAVWLPLAGQRERPAARDVRELPRGNGETVLIVDDERPLVALAEEILAELGYEPTGFHSSAAALQAFRSNPQRYDVVLTDETMPELVGTELAREITRLRPEVPVLLMSGYTGRQLAERARAAGVAEVLRKPLASRDIAEALERVIVSRESAPQAA